MRGRARLGALVATLALVCAGCTSGARGASSCGAILSASTGGRHVSLSGCSGVLGVRNDQPSLTVHPGGVVTIEHLAPGYEDVGSSAPAVLRVVGESSGEATLRALVAGAAVVTVRTPYCGDPSKKNACPALLVTVS